MNGFYAKGSRKNSYSTDIEVKYKITMSMRL